MASEAEVRSEISEVPIEDRCGLDMSSYEDLPKLDGDCNGVNNKHVDDDKVQVEEQDTELNGNGKVDPDGLYVLVSRSDSVDGDPIDCDLNVECVNKSHTLPESTVGSLNIDVEGQVGQLNDEEDEETVSVVDNCIGKVADVDVDVLVVAPDRSLVKPIVDGDAVLLQDQNSTAVVESEDELPDNKAEIEKQIEPDFGSLNRDVEGQVGNLNDEDRETMSAEDSCVAEVTDVVSDGSLVKPKADVDGVLLQDQNATAVVESEHELLYNKAKVEKQIEPDLGSSNKDVEVQVGQLTDENRETVSAEDNCIGVVTDIASDGSLVKRNVDGDNVLLQDQSSMAVVESEHELLDSKAKIEKQIEPDFGALEDVEGQVGQLNDKNGETLSVEDNCIAEVTDVAPKGSLVKGDMDEDNVPLQDQNAMESEHELIDSKAKNEMQIEPDLASDLQENPNFPTLVMEVSHCGIPQPDEGKIESEEQTNLESTAELGEVCESKIVVSGVGEEKSEKQNNLESNAYFKESKEAQIAISEAAESESSMLNDGEVNYKAYINLESTPELEGNRESQVIVSEAFESNSPEVENRKVIAEKQNQLGLHREVKESLESQISKPESVSYQLDNGEKLEEEEKTDLRIDIKENKESQPVVAGFSSGVDEGNKVANLANETDIPLETEIASEHASDGNKDSYPTSQVEDSISQVTVLNELIDCSQNTTELNGSSENAKKLPSPACMTPEIKIGCEPVEIIISCPAKDAKLEIEVKNDIVGGAIVTSCNEMSSETDTGLHSVDPEGKVSTSSCADVNIESEVSNKVTDCACSQPIDVNDLDLEYLANDSLQNGSGAADMNSESEVENSSSISGRDMPCNDVAVSQPVVLDGFVVPRGSTQNRVPEALDVQDVGDKVNGGDDSDNLIDHKNQDTERLHRAEISTSSPEGSSADALHEQGTGVEAVKRPFHFLIKIPKYVDEKQFRDAQQQVEEKTHLRDAIQVDIQIIRANCELLHKSYGAAKTEEKAARALVKSKRQEIDSVQSVINRVKNAVSVKQIDVRIHDMEHMIQHETLPLKEEKQFIREIKQLKLHREQLSSNMGSRDEVQQALDQRDQIEERLKILKKELDCLKDKVSKAEAAVVAAEKKCIDESKKLNGLHAQFRAADEIRQEAYAHFLNIKKQLYEKNARFRMYKGDAMKANEYALSGDKEALHRLCVNQVETVIELWNKNDEFRNEYLSRNTRSTMRRLRTLDGRALGPDEETTLLPNVVDERIEGPHSTAGKANSELPSFTLEQEKRLSTVEDEETDDKSTAKVPEQIVQTTITKKPGKPTLRNGSATVSGRDEMEEMIEEEHNKQTKEEQELARKEEELRKEEAATKLKEQRRLEEKAKAMEALERKRRNAEKAHIRAELRAQKEAEQKEKEREKRAKKKEKKKSAAAEDADGNHEGEAVPTSESPVVTTEEPEIRENPSTITKRPQKVVQFTKQSKTKSIPPPLRNRGKRRMQQWIWIILVGLLVLALFLLGSIGFYSNLGHNLRMRSSGF
ncbi:Proton pump-interactor 1 [Camellia lanceoleosa]|uniref:Proton pump-interactor 1 n=1 Tax=Camellia lanceoleosa TaxID=1840588 RepID=A0ACC0GS48_9ERIC|nr:Proton pump-interactor 1 [Camellia lanceoleosa]